MDLTTTRPNLAADWTAKSETVLYRFIDLGYEMFRVYWRCPLPTGSSGCHVVSAALANEMLRELRSNDFSIKCTSYSEEI
jgi:hypothetical protein